MSHDPDKEEEKEAGEEDFVTANSKLGNTLLRCMIGNPKSERLRTNTTDSHVLMSLRS